MPSPAVTLTFDILTSKSNKHIHEPKYICDQNWVKFPSLHGFWDMCSQVFRDVYTHSLTDGHTRKQNASHTGVAAGRGMKAGDSVNMLFHSQLAFCSTQRSWTTSSKLKDNITDSERVIGGQDSDRRYATLDRNQMRSVSAALTARDAHHHCSADQSASGLQPSDPLHYGVPATTNCFLAGRDAKIDCPSWAKRP